MFDQTNTLTAGTDSLTGTAGNDTISGARIDTVQTLNSGDTINGGAGSDTLSANLNAGTIAPTISGVEAIQLTAIGAATVDFVNTTGVTSIVNSASSAALIVDNVATIAAVTVQNTDQASTITFKDAAVSGSADSLTLTLSAASGTITIGSEADDDGDIESFNIVATGGDSAFAATEIDFGTDATSITVSGSAELTMNADAAGVFANVNTFDASANTGGVAVTFADRPSTGEDVIAFTGGSGDDDFDISLVVAADVSTRTIDMGAGDDVLTVDLAEHDTSFSAEGGAGTDALELGSNTAITTAAILAKFTGFEQLSIGAGRTISQDMDFSVGSVVNVTAATSVTLTDVASSGTVVNVKGGTTTTLDVSDLKANSASDSITVNLGGTTAAILTTLTASTNYETITVNSIGSVANTLTGLGAAVTNLLVNATQDLTIGSTANISSVLDAGSSTGEVTITVTNTASQTVTLGSGDDTVTATGAVVTGAVQVFNLGSGDDTFTAGAVIGGLTIDAGAGSDVINTSASLSAALAATDVVSITGGSGHDFITLATGASDETIVVTATNSDDADYAINFSASTGTDAFDYNGAVSNGGTTTIQTATIAATTSLNADVAALLASDTNDTVYIIGFDLTGEVATDLTQMVAAAVAGDTSLFATEIATFETKLAAALGTIANLDSLLGSSDAVLFQFDQGTDSIVVRVTNTDTTVANTLTAAEIEVVFVNDSDILAAADYV